MTRREPGRERGAVAVVVAVMIVALVATLAVALNTGHLLSVRGEIQNGVDSAALAGAIQLNGTPGRLAPARTAASEFAGEHVTDGQDAISVAPDAVELGHWYRDTKRFEVVGGTDADAARSINAVRVAYQRSEAVMLSFFLGRGSPPGPGPGPAPQGGGGGGASDVQVGAAAVAVTGGPCTSECGNMPFVIRTGCVLGRCPDVDPGNVVSGGVYYVALSSDGVDTAGLTNLLPVVGVNKPAVCGILTDPDYCEEHRPDGEDDLEEGDVVDTGNGAPWGATCSSEAGSICEILQSRVGTTAKIPIVRFAGEPETQCDGKYVAFAEIEGFATFKTLLVQCKAKGTVRYDESLSPEAAAELAAPCELDKEAQICLVLELLCGVKDAEPSDPGCAWFGTSTMRPKLAR